MAEGEPVGFIPITELLTQDNVRTRVEAFKRELRQITTVATEDGAAFPDDFQMSHLVSTILIAINGTGDLPEQKVQVQYLAHNQQLRLPSGLGMIPGHQELSEAALNETLVNKYWILASKSLQDLVNVVDAAGTFVQKQAVLDAWAVPDPLPAEVSWNGDNYYTLANGRGNDIGYVSAIFATICRMMRINFDIRDMGALSGTVAEMRMPDSAWKDITTVLKSRLTSKLHPYTMSCIAALNLAPCRGFAVGAWIRSFGVCAGILPAQNTRLTKEWMYTGAGFTAAEQRAVEAAQVAYRADLQPLCLNAIAIFGLMHLNKNHTFITGDTSMARVGQAFINTLRVMLAPEQIVSLIGNQEVVVRTAVHPFGLGQSYAVAKIMGKWDMLVSPLQLRLSVAPPLTQRLMIVQAAVREWNMLPVGATMRQIYGDQMAIINQAVTAIKANPPAFSELYGLYGEPNQVLVPQVAKDAADGMMPIVYGYAKAFHTAGETQKDGLALAMSFENVLRDFKAASTLYEAMWSAYYDKMETGGLEEFIKKAYELGGATMPAV